MQTLNTTEIETVAGGIHPGAMPLIIVAIPTQPTPKPSTDPVNVY